MHQFKEGQFVTVLGHAGEYRIGAIGRDGNGNTILQLFWPNTGAYAGARNAMHCTFVR